MNMPMNRPDPQPMQPMPTQTPVQPPKMSPAPKKRKWLTMLVALVVLLAVAGGVYFWQQKKINDLDKQVAELKVSNFQLDYQLRDLRSSLTR